MGRTLEGIRADLGLSQSELGRRVGISHTMIRRYERGLSEPTITVGARYAEHLNITMTDLIHLIGRGTDG